VFYSHCAWGTLFAEQEKDNNINTREKAYEFDIKLVESTHNIEIQH